MKKIITLFLIFLLYFSAIFENDLILSSADVKQESTLNDDTQYNTLQNNEVQPDPKENPSYIMGGDSLEYNSSLPTILTCEQTKLNSNAIGSGTINTDTLNVRSGPSTSYNKVGSLSNGDYIEIYERSNNWYKIIYNNQFAYISCNYVNLNILEKGIDVSKWNGSINWNKVKSSGIDYVIIRAGYGTSTVDPNFKSNIEGASAAGLKIGVYWFSYATSVDKVKIEAEKCLETINPYKNNISYPVYFDYEYDSVDYASEKDITITKDLASEMANTFINTIKLSGYDTGLYTNQDFSNKYFNTELLYSNNLWIAQYNSQCTFNKPYMMWQYTDKGSVDGINGYVDMNYTYLKSINNNYINSVPPNNNNDDDDSHITTENSVIYKTHVENYGWQNWKSNGKTSGTTNQNKQLEAIELKLVNTSSDAKIIYQTHIQDYGWQNWKCNGETSGTTGQSKQLEAIKIKLENMDGYSIKYRVHIQDYGWQDWKSNGEIAGTEGQHRQIEAIEVKIVKLDTINLEYQTHVQDYGWLNWSVNGQTNGTINQSKRIEAIQLKLTDAPSNAKVVYQTHVQDYGWLDWKSNGETSGTTSQSKQVEAIRIKLENMDGYTVKYRVHVQDSGWLDWKSNGEIAGTEGQHKRVEAIEVKLIKR